MKAMPGQEQKQTGSFGKLPQPKTDEKQEEIKAVPPKDEMADAVREEQKIEFNKILDGIQDKLGFTIEEADILDFVRKGKLVKKVQIIPGILTATFQTLNGEETQKIQEKIHAFQNSNSTTTAGIGNDSAFWNLTYGLAEYQGKDLTAVTDKQKVKELLLKLGAHVVDKMNAAYLDFNFVIRSKMNDPELIKK